MTPQAIPPCLASNNENDIYKEVVKNVGRALTAKCNKWTLKSNL